MLLQTMARRRLRLALHQEVCGACIQPFPWLISPFKGPSRAKVDTLSSASAGESIILRARLHTSRAQGRSAIPTILTSYPLIILHFRQ